MVGCGVLGSAGLEVGRMGGMTKGDGKGKPSEVRGGMA